MTRSLTKTPNQVGEITANVIYDNAYIPHPDHAKSRRIRV